MKTIRNLVLKAKSVMYRLYIEDVAGALLHCQDGELAVLIREYSAAYLLPKYQKVWRRTKQDGGAYADFVHDLSGKLHLFKVVKLTLLAPRPAGSADTVS